MLADRRLGSSLHNNDVNKKQKIPSVTGADRARAVSGASKYIPVTGPDRTEVQTRRQEPHCGSKVAMGGPGQARIEAEAPRRSPGRQWLPKSAGNGRNMNSTEARSTIASISANGGRALGRWFPPHEGSRRAT